MGLPIPTSNPQAVALVGVEEQERRTYVPALWANVPGGHPTPNVANVINGGGLYRTYSRPPWRSDMRRQNNSMRLMIVGSGMPNCETLNVSGVAQTVMVAFRQPGIDHLWGTSRCGRRRLRGYYINAN